MRTGRAILVLSLVALFCSSPALATYTIASGHPRLFVLAQDVPTLRARCQGALSSEFGEIESFCDQHMSDSFPLSTKAYGWHLTTYSFAWLMGGNTQYANRAKAIGQDVVNRDNLHSLDVIEGLSHLLDWCYDALTPQERTTFGTALAEAAEWWMNDTDWSTTTNYHEKLSFLEGVIYPGIALYGEGIDNQMARACCDTFQHHVFSDRHVLCCYDEIGGDGSWFEGDYNIYRIYHRGREAVEAWAVATGQSAWDVSGNFQNLGRYYLYEAGARTAGAYGLYAVIGSKQGDSHNHSVSPNMFRYALYNAARRYSDGHAQWLANEIKRVGAGAIEPQEMWRIIVWNDPAAPEDPPTNLPTAACFREMGTAYMRSGWDISDDSEDVYAVFRCETIPSFHSHAHQNHFMIARGNDLLAIDSGDYDSSISSHHHNYFCRTIAHNSITVFDPNETTFMGYSNDGGQKAIFNYDDNPVHCGDASHPQFYRGHVTAFQDADTFTYVKGDATAAYAASKLNLFTREFVYLKPDIFVVFDRVDATSASFDKNWLLHSIGEPQINGQIVTITEGASRLFVKTLLPSPSSVTKVGGSGHEFEVNGVNYPPSGSSEGDMGSWRVEVSPTQPATEHLFLHVLYACGAGVSQMPEAQLIDAGEMVGVEVAGRVVLFSRTGIAVDSVEYEFGG